MLAAQAKERQKIYCRNQYDKKSGLPQNSAEVQKGETREDIAKIAGVSTPNPDLKIYWRIRKIMKGITKNENENL